MFTAKYLFAEIVPGIKVSNKTEFMIDCQLATGSESPQLGGEQQHQLPHLLLNWKGALLAYNSFIIFVIIVTLLIILIILEHFIYM